MLSGLYIWVMQEVSGRSSNLRERDHFLQRSFGGRLELGLPPPSPAIVHKTQIKKSSPFPRSFEISGGAGEL